jgi:hypothetical protein
MTEYMDLGEFRAAGYLAEVNRRILHPLGLALTVEADEQGALRLAGVQDHREDPEGVYFADPRNLAGKAAKVAAEERRRRPAREAALGYWVQPLPGENPEGD